MNLLAASAGGGGRPAVPAVRAQGQRRPLRALAARPHDAGRQGRRHALCPLHPQLHRWGSGRLGTLKLLKPSKMRKNIVKMGVDGAPI